MILRVSVSACVNACLSIGFPDHTATCQFAMKDVARSRRRYSTECCMGAIGGSVGLRACLPAMWVSGSVSICGSVLRGAVSLWVCRSLCLRWPTATTRAQRRVAWSRGSKPDLRSSPGPSPAANPATSPETSPETSLSTCPSSGAQNGVAHAQERHRWVVSTCCGHCSCHSARRPDCGRT